MLMNNRMVGSQCLHFHCQPSNGKFTLYWHYSQPPTLITRVPVILVASYVLRTILLIVSSVSSTALSTAVFTAKFLSLSAFVA